MSKIRKGGLFSKVLLIAFVLLLTSCDEGTKNTDGTSTEHQENQTLEQTKEDKEQETQAESENTETPEKETSNETEKTDQETPIEENTSETTDKQSMLKDMYIEQIKEAQAEVANLVPTDSSTYALKKTENDRWKIWDDLLNDTYRVLEEQLPSQEMERLREKQREWITYRDQSALGASEKFKGGTQEQLEYVSVLANLTEERCVELVEGYMG
ncbi:lysozyme inhibitor LprI family protein [Pontibacillus salipaludis]|uniref:lysozyme inhibitor LprI family protein n=1 Tax=Pontibacillus salipaludis TaxID=1697394 RepID=UPI0031EEA493